MDAVEYFKIKNRICAAQEDTCDGCPLTNDCLSKELEAPEEIVKIADEYKKIIPKKVYEVLMNYEIRIENDKNYKI